MGLLDFFNRFFPPKRKRPVPAPPPRSYVSTFGRQYRYASRSEPAVDTSNDIMNPLNPLSPLSPFNPLNIDSTPESGHHNSGLEAEQSSPTHSVPDYQQETRQSDPAPSHDHRYDPSPDPSTYSAPDSSDYSSNSDSSSSDGGGYSSND